MTEKPSPSLPEEALETRSDDPAFWQVRYENQNKPWDLGAVAPPFQTLIQSHTLSTGTMAVVGCGAGHDAAGFAQAGFAVTGFDFAPGAIEEATQRYGQLARFVLGDIFNLPDMYDGAFDYVLEHTCYCAILPKMRDDYVQAIQRLLKPGGELIGLFWAHQEWGGPPYKTDETDLRERFSPYFDIESIVLADNSVESRRGEELLVRMRKKG